MGVLAAQVFVGAADALGRGCGGRPHPRGGGVRARSSRHPLVGGQPRGSIAAASRAGPADRDEDPAHHRHRERGLLPGLGKHAGARRGALRLGGHVDQPGAARLVDDGPGGVQIANYEGVVVATSGLEGLSAAQWATLQTYEHQFSVRQVTAYVFPSEDYGLTTPAVGMQLTSATPLALTSDGAKTFPYLKAMSLDPSSPTYGYEATRLSAANVDTLVSGPNASSMLGIYTAPDGRQIMYQTFDENPYMLQSELLRHGELAWLTRDTYFGTERNYLETDIDDTFLADDAWSIAETPPPGPIRRTTTPPMPCVRSRRTSSPPASGRPPTDSGSTRSSTAGAALSTPMGAPKPHQATTGPGRRRRTAARRLPAPIHCWRSSRRRTRRPGGRTPPTSAGSATPGITPTSMRDAPPRITSRLSSTRTPRGQRRRPPPGTPTPAAWGCPKARAPTRRSEPRIPTSSSRASTRACRTSSRGIRDRSTRPTSTR